MELYNFQSLWCWVCWRATPLRFLKKTPFLSVLPDIVCRSPYFIVFACKILLLLFVKAPFYWLNPACWWWYSHLACWLVIQVILHREKHDVLRVIPTVTNYLFIASGISSGCIFGIYVLTFYSGILSGILSGISDILSGIYSGILFDLSEDCRPEIWVRGARHPLRSGARGEETRREEAGGGRRRKQLW
jgi:hypothetical protein